MHLKIQAVKRKEMPSRWGGTWTITSVKFEGMENPQFGYELKGYGKLADKFQAGDTVRGYFSTYSYQGKETIVVRDTFNKITPEYVYDLLLAMNPAIEKVKDAPKKPMVDEPEEEAKEDEDPNW